MLKSGYGKNASQIQMPHKAAFQPCVASKEVVYVNANRKLTVVNTQSLIRDRIPGKRVLNRFTALLPITVRAQN
jgi:hypothetical protein